MVLPIVFVGGAMVCLGAIFMLSGVPDLRRRRRIVETRTSRIADAREGLVEIAGRIVVGDNGALTAPFSRREAVFVRVRVEEYQAGGDSSGWTTVLSEETSREFYVEDGSGERGRVDPAGATFVLDRDKAMSGEYRRLPPSFARFLAERGVSSKTWLGVNKHLRFEERVLGVGDAVYALGPAVREAGPPAQDGYRTATTTQLVLASKGSGDGELLLTNKPESALAGKMLEELVSGAIIVGIGVIVLGFGWLAG